MNMTYKSIISKSEVVAYGRYQARGSRETPQAPTNR